MNIWIDLSNSPHVLFFKPIIQKLEVLGHQVELTHRDFAQTSQLCSIFGIESTPIGTHGGKRTFKKIFNISKRAYDLRKFAKAHAFDLACSHNSYAHCIAAKSLRIPYLTLMDYEHQPANHINFRFSNKVLVPFTFELNDIRKYGKPSNRIVKYPGLKEEVYLFEFQQRKNFWREKFPDLDHTKVLCPVRPPATMAAYHNFENPLFFELIEFLLNQKSLQMVVFPRTEAQKTRLESQFYNLYIANKSVDGAQLIANSDMVISAGGTMNREAAVLGTPAYSVYAGKTGSVDKYLKAAGKLVFIKKRTDFLKINITKKNNPLPRISAKTFNFITEQLTNGNFAK